MKKFLSLLLVAVLVSAMFAIPVSADEYFWSEGEYELVADGNWSPYFSWGYVFEIDSVNSTSGSMTAIFDNATDYAAKGPGKWTTQLVLAPVAGEEGVYELVAAHKTTGKNAQANLDDGTIDFEDGKIVLSVQDAGTRPEKNDDGTLKFPNWEDRAAAWGLINTIGAKLTLDGNTLTVEDDPEAPIEITNVALNKSYEISGIGERPEGYTGKVTDGIVPVGLGENKETEWFGFYHNGDRPTNAPDKVGYFIIDLEDEYALTSIRTHLINKDGWGVEIPEAVTAYVSLDGSAFEEVGSFEIDSTDGVEYWTEIEVDCNAKYVKVEFKLGGTFAFVSEIEVMGGKPGAAGDDEEPKEDIEAKMKELLGVTANAKVDYVIEAPESYEAGDEITVTVTVKNITAENGIHVAAFKLLYDNEKLLLTNDLDEEDENALLCVKTLPKDWENLSSVANDYNADNEEGTVVNPLNDGVINVSVFTAKSSASAAIKEDGALVLEFTFKALEDAEGDIGLVIPHADAECAFNGKNGEEVYAANGSYAVIKAPVVEEESKPGDDPVEPGDASSMIIFAIIALVAIAGSAVVVKTRR